MRAICYKTKKPVVYNEGTAYERTCDEFLAYGTYKDESEGKAEVEMLNTTKPDKLPFNGEKIDWEKVDYFFYKVQEDF